MLSCCPSQLPLSIIPLSALYACHLHLIPYFTRHLFLLPSLHSSSELCLFVFSYPVFFTLPFMSSYFDSCSVLCHRPILISSISIIAYKYKCAVMALTNESTNETMQFDFHNFIVLSNLNSNFEYSSITYLTFWVKHCTLVCRANCCCTASILVNTNIDKR